MKKNSDYMDSIYNRQPASSNKYYWLSAVSVTYYYCWKMYAVLFQV